MIFTITVIMNTDLLSRQGYKTMKKTKLKLFFAFSWLCLLFVKSICLGYSAYEYIFEWPVGAADISPVDVVVDNSTKHVFMNDGWSERLVEYDGTGAILNTWPYPGDFCYITMDQSYVYSTVVDYSKQIRGVNDVYYDNVIRIPKAGGDVKVLLSDTTSETEPGRFMEIGGIVVDSDYIYVGDAGDNAPARIQKFTKADAPVFITSWTVPNAVKGMVIDESDGGIFVSIWNDTGIRKFTKDGVDISGAWSSVNLGARPLDIDLGPDNNLYILLGSTLGVHVYSKDGIKKAETIGGNPLGFGAGKGEFNVHTLGGISVDKLTGNIYVADRLNHRIQVFRGVDASSVVFTPLGSPTAGILKPINNICMPENGNKIDLNYYLATAGVVTMKIYSPSGKLVKTLIKEEFMAAGTHNGTTDSRLFWGGENTQGDIVASGIYLVHIEGPGISETKKVCIVRQ